MKLRRYFLNFLIFIVFLFTVKCTGDSLHSTSTILSTDTLTEASSSTTNSKSILFETIDSSTVHLGINTHTEFPEETTVAMSAVSTSPEVITEADNDEEDTVSDTVLETSTPTASDVTKQSAEQEITSTMDDQQASSHFITNVELSVATVSVTSEKNTVAATNSIDNDATEEEETGMDCETLIVILSSTFATVLLLLTVCCLYGMWKIRKTWRQKLQEEKQKTDIWTMSTFNNTVVNENYMDFVSGQEHDSLQQTTSDATTATSGTHRSSAATSGTRNSELSNEFTAVSFPFFGQKGARGSQKLPSKLYAGRSRSSYSPDSVTVPDPESRGRASTFTHGRRNKVKHDTHVLVENIETDEEQQGILESVDKVLKTQNEHIVTEL